MQVFVFGLAVLMRGVMHLAGSDAVCGTRGVQIRLGGKYIGVSGVLSKLHDLGQ